MAHHRIAMRSSSWCLAHLERVCKVHTSLLRVNCHSTRCCECLTCCQDSAFGYAFRQSLRWWSILGELAIAISILVVLTVCTLPHRVENRADMATLACLVARIRGDNVFIARCWASYEILDVFDAVFALSESDASIVCLKTILCHLILFMQWCSCKMLTLMRLCRESVRCWDIGIGLRLWQALHALLELRVSHVRVAILTSVQLVMGRVDSCLIIM